ncbi:glutathione S-transferase family protein [Gluconobacter cerinus]|uniref:glutathione S-transferase family protein n=2 Tax=Gluconobacter TaxID=441 RepID=UPI0038CFF68A
MLEELSVPYRVNLVDLVKGEQFEPAFLKLSPNNRIPALIDPRGPNEEPISVFESGAILQYLGRKFGCFYPREERKRVEVDQWLFWQVGGAWTNGWAGSPFPAVCPNPDRLCYRTIYAGSRAPVRCA